MKNARVRRSKDTYVEGATRKKERSKSVRVENLINGEQTMKLTKSKSLGRSLAFGKVKIMDSVSVEIECDQDYRTAKRANVIARNLIDEFLAQDIKESEDILKEIMEMENEEDER